MLSKIKEELEHLRKEDLLKEVYLNAQSILYDYQNEYEKINIDSERCEKFLDFFKNFYYQLEGKIYDFDAFGNGLVEIHEPVLQEGSNSSPDFALLAPLLRGYTDETYKDTEKEFRASWDYFKQILKSKINLTLLKNYWLQSSSHFPAVELRFNRPNYKYLQEHTIFLCLWPDEIPLEYSVELVMN